MPYAIRPARIRFLLGTGSSILFLWLALRNVSVYELRAALAGADYPLLTLALATVLLTTLAKTARWRVLLAASYAPTTPTSGVIRALPLAGLFSALLVGQLVNAVVPARLGEVARAYLAGQVEGVSRATALATIVAEKTLDGVTLAALLVWLALLGRLDWPPLAVTTGAVFVAIFVVLAWAGGHADRVLSLARRVSVPRSAHLTAFLLARMSPGSSAQARTPEHAGVEPLGGLFAADPAADPAKASTPREVDRTLNRADAFFESVLDGLAGLRGGGSRALWLWTLAIWGLAALTNALVFLALGLTLPMTAALLLLAVLQVGSLVPAAPGRVGTFHYLTVLTLSTFSVAPGPALATGIVLHLLVMGPLMLLGALALLWSISSPYARSRP